ncbi:dihydrodipicolinate synthase family protein [Tersicoccus solisilvae]|uniref:Dihydrodipicolinate synthase family protein n=1 Tax=Tersicoccus solisilvae TaxID=1882339 RepID=A0ABQ1P246_9MICC|nr:dihydrodipicolinate synthase family protein [Tersicoccus solisilvae]GGC87893.1 dihydrodipicolinate synthase family protein [Tersicoccus solisilvae]
MFTGLSAFPLTPLRRDGRGGETVDDAAFVRLIDRLTAARVDSITALGSTGSAAYLDAAERAHVARLAVDHAGDVPVVVGIGALRTAHAVAHAEAAQRAGAAGLLLAPLTYQPLTDDEVVGLYRDVTAATALPVIVYDNPTTTRVTFSLDLYARIGALPGIASIKIPGVPEDPDRARDHVRAIRSVLPEHVTIGVSGDARAAAGLTAGCDAWYSVLAGTLPVPARRITDAVRQGRPEEATAESARLQPLWALFAAYGSIRVIAAVAEHLGLAPVDCLPLPLRGLTADQRADLARVVEQLVLAG